MFRKFKITCEQAHEICNKSQYNEASFSEKLKLRFHLLVCKLCSLYVKQNSQITKICDQRAKELKDEPATMSHEQKEILKEKLKQFN